MGAMMIKGVARLPLSLSDLGLLLVKDFCITGIWFTSLLGNTVRWGDRLLRITPDGRLEELRPGPKVQSDTTPAPQSVHPIASSAVSDASPGSR